MAIVDPNIIAQQEAQKQIALQQALAAQGPVPAPAAAGPGVVPVSPGVAAPTISAIQDPGAGLDNTILGLTPEQFQAVAGGLAQALAPPDTWQSRMGEFAKALGQGKIVGGLTGEDVTGAALKPKAPEKAKKSGLADISALPTELDLSGTLLGGN